MTGGRATAPLLLGLLAAGGLAAWLLAGGPGAGVSTPGVRGAPEPDAPPAPAGWTPLAAEGAPAPEPPVQAPAEPAPAAPTARERFAEGLSRWQERRAALATARGTEAADGEDAALAEVRTALIRQLWDDPGLADDLWRAIEASEREEALSLARILRFSKTRALGARLAALLAGAQDPVHREAALVALAGREADLWFEPVTAAFARDSDERVRRRAAQFLGQALGDRAYLPERERLRAPLLEALASPDAVQRERAVVALGWDAFAGPEDLARLEAIGRSDPDAKVRQAALGASRILRNRIDARAAR